MKKMPEFALCEVTAAEGLLFIYKTLMQQREKLVVVRGDLDDATTNFAQTALAVRFHNRGPGFHMKALVEGWTLDRIIREMNT